VRSVLLPRYRSMRVTDLVVIYVRDCAVAVSHTAAAVSASTNASAALYRQAWLVRLS
jgi:hypothetical protein